MVSASGASFFWGTANSSFQHLFFPDLCRHVEMTTLLWVPLEHVIDDVPELDFLAHSCY